MPGSPPALSTGSASSSYFLRQRSALLLVVPLKLPSAQPPPPPHHPSINPHPPRCTVQPSALHRVLVIIPAASSFLRPSLHPLIVPPSSCRPPQSLRRTFITAPRPLRPFNCISVSIHHPTIIPSFPLTSSLHPSSGFSFITLFSCLLSGLNNN